MKKILHIITRLDAGGSATNTLETCARLDKNKYDVTLLSGKTCDPEELVSSFIKDKNVSCIFFNDLLRSIHPWKDFKVFIQIYKFIKSEHFDIVHTHSSKAGILGRWAARLADVKHIIHTPHGHVFYGYFNKIISMLFIVAERCTAGITDKIITLTDMGRDEHVKYKIAPEEKFVTIHSGIDLNKFNPDLRIAAQYRDIWNVHSDDIAFGVVARLDPIKGNEFIIEAMIEVIKEIPKAKLIFIGDGSQRKILEEKRDSLGLTDHIIFTGHQTDVKNYIAMLDVFVLASLNEGMGRVILEAMACEKPVIASRVGGIPELVKEGVNGCLVPARDISQLAEVMIQLGKDESMRDSFGCEAKRRATEIFSLDQMIKDIENLYERLLN